MARVSKKPTIQYTHWVASSYDGDDPIIFTSEAEAKRYNEVMHGGDGSVRGAVIFDPNLPAGEFLQREARNRN